MGATRALLQSGLTVATLVTAVISVIFGYIFGNHVKQMQENFRGEPREDRPANLPCIRSTLDACDASKVGKCWEYCCPAGYLCSRSPIVGLYCQEGAETCGNHNWCRDFADIPRSCQTETCQKFRMIERVSTWSYVMACIGIFLDLVDIITIFTLPDSVIFKAGVNIFSSLMKWIAFGLVIGAGTASFLADLETAKCYNPLGMDLVSNSQSYFITYIIVQVVSAILSLVLAPISSYYGGKLQGVPYVK